MAPEPLPRSRKLVLALESGVEHGEGVDTSRERWVSILGVHDDSTNQVVCDSSSERGRGRGGSVSGDADVDVDVEAVLVRCEREVW